MKLKMILTGATALHSMGVAAMLADGRTSDGVLRSFESNMMRQPADMRGGSTLTYGSQLAPKTVALAPIDTQRGGLQHYVDAKTTIKAQTNVTGGQQTGGTC